MQREKIIEGEVLFAMEFLEKSEVGQTLFFNANPKYLWTNGDALSEDHSHEGYFRYHGMPLVVIKKPEYFSKHDDFDDLVDRETGTRLPRPYIRCSVVSEDSELKRLGYEGPVMEELNYYGYPPQFLSIESPIFGGVVGRLTEPQKTLLISRDF